MYMYMYMYDMMFLPFQNYDHLPKADVFALGLTAYCAVCPITLMYGIYVNLLISLLQGSCYELPKNGDNWHSIRYLSMCLLTEGVCVCV